MAFPRKWYLCWDLNSGSEWVMWKCEVGIKGVFQAEETASATALWQKWAWDCGMVSEDLSPRRRRSGGRGQPRPRCSQLGTWASLCGDEDHDKALNRGTNERQTTAHGPEPACYLFYVNKVLLEPSLAAYHLHVVDGCFRGRADSQSLKYSL